MKTTKEIEEHLEELYNQNKKNPPIKIGSRYYPEVKYWVYDYALGTCGREGTDTTEGYLAELDTQDELTCSLEKPEVWKKDAHEVYQELVTWIQDK